MSGSPTVLQLDHPVKELLWSWVLWLHCVPMHACVPRNNANVAQAEA